jgi:hypothetical protein
MMKQKTEPVSVIGMIVGLAALIAVVLVLSVVIKYAQPMAPGMTRTIGVTSTEESTPAPTYLKQWRETAAAAVMQTQFAMIKTITPNPPPTGRPPTNTPAPFLTGIFEISNGPFGDPHAYPMSAVWAEVVNGERTLVYIGGHGDYGYVYAATPAVIQGVVVVEVSSEDLSNSSWVKYVAPGATSALRIVSTDGYRLKLADKRGDMFYFDVLTRQFVDSLNATVTAPTITPLPPTGLPPTITLEAFIPGINEMSYAAYVNPQSAVITSQWREMVNGQRTFVYAGANRDTSGATPDTRKGLIVVDVYSTDFSNHLITFYNAPGSTGVLRIISANGYRLILASQNDETLYFDVLTRQFVDSLNATVTAPTVTPLPPISPTAAPPTAIWSTEYPAPGTYPPQIYPPPSTPTPIP